jgi:ABC-2 type transport system permease protein
MFPQGENLMRAYWTLTRRELAGFFFSITGYVIIAAAAFLLGFSFYILISKSLGTPLTAPVTEIFYDTAYFWLILLLAVPVITMRLFALEKFSGTYETLMTTPVSDFQVVAAKFTGAIVFYMMMWLPLLGCLLILQHYTSGQGAFDTGAVGCTFLGILLIGCLFISLGCFASALTHSQTTAAMIGVFLSMSLFMSSWLSDKLPSSGWKSQVLSLFALRDQMSEFVRGVVDTRTVVFYVSLTFFILFLTLRVIESRRWK